MEDINVLEIMKDDVYIYPDKAIEKLNLAYENSKPVYIYGMTGFGKTALIKHYLNLKEYLYLESEEDIEQLSLNFNNKEDDSNKKIVVIDNLQFIELEATKEKIIDIIKNKNLWVIIISRANCPIWLLSYRLKQASFVIIDEADLAMSKKNIENYFSIRGLILNDELIEDVTSITRNNAMAMRIAADVMIKNQENFYRKNKIELGMKQQFQSIFWDYLDYYVFGQWEQEIYEFYTQMSIVDKFTIDLAETITGKENVEYIVKRSKELGNFLHNYRELYWVDEAMMLSMKRHLNMVFNKQQRNELYYNAGHYYKRNGEIMSALKMFEACENHNQISQILVENARINPSVGHLYELRHYYLSMDEKIISEKIELMACMSMLQSILLNPEESDRWYDAICLKEKIYSGTKKKDAKSWIAYLNIALPHRGTKDMISTIKNAGALLQNKSIAIPELGVTGNSDSQMNGGKDFCNWSKKDKELANSIGKVIEFTLGKKGVGCVDLALAESYFEKAMDDYEIISHVSKAQIKIATKGNIELSLVANSILGKISLFNGNPENYRELIMDFRNIAVANRETRFLPNVDNYLCRINMYKGEISEVEEWLNNSPNELDEFYTIYRHIYLTKVRIYIWQKKYEKAYALLTKLQYYADVCDRTYIKMECDLLLAIIEYRNNKKSWKKTLQKAYTEIEKYDFVRIISREGIAILPLLNSAELKVKKEEFFEKVIDETQRMAAYYPSYLKVQNIIEEEFSENAIQVLKYQSEGLSNEKIAEKMAINIGTVKYHCRENYRKLGVSGKAAAVSEAKKRKLI